MQVHFCKASVNLRNNNKYCTERKRDETSYFFSLLAQIGFCKQRQTFFLSGISNPFIFVLISIHRGSQSLSLHHRACYNMSSLYFHLSLFLHNKTPTSTNNNRQTVKKCSLFVDRGKDLRLIVIEIRRENHEFTS